MDRSLEIRTRAFARLGALGPDSGTSRRRGAAAVYGRSGAWPIREVRAHRLVDNAQHDAEQHHETREKEDGNLREWRRAKMTDIGSVARLAGLAKGRQWGAEGGPGGCRTVVAKRIAGMAAFVESGRLGETQGAAKGTRIAIQLFAKFLR